MQHQSTSTDTTPATPRYGRTRDTRHHDFRQQQRAAGQFPSALATLKQGRQELTSLNTWSNRLPVPAWPAKRRPKAAWSKPGTGRSDERGLLCLGRAGGNIGLDFFFAKMDRDMVDRDRLTEELVEVER